MSSRNRSIVDDWDGTPTTIAWCFNARLTIWVLHARIVDLTLLVVKDEFILTSGKEVLDVEFAVSFVQTLGKNEDSSRSHGAFIISWWIFTKATESPSKNLDFREVIKRVNSLSGSLISGEPQLRLKGLDGAFSPDLMSRSPDHSSS